MRALAFQRLTALVLAALLLPLAAACGGGDAGGSPTSAPVTSPPALSPTAAAQSPSPSTTSPVPGSCPVDTAACQLAAAIQRGMQSGDIDPVVAAFEPAEAVCAPPGQGVDPAAALCRGKAPGERVTGYPIGVRASEGALLGRSALVQFLARFALGAPVEASDGYGDALVKVVTFGAPARPECGEECLTAVFTYIEKPAGATERFVRKVMTFDFERRAGAWKVTGVLDGFLFPPEVPALLAGGEYDGRTYRYWDASGRRPPPAPGPGGPFALGQTVKLAGPGACVEQRTAPSPAGAVAACTPAGTPVQLDDNADAGATEWWLARPIGPGSAAGWVPATALVP